MSPEFDEYGECGALSPSSPVLRDAGKGRAECEVLLVLYKQFAVLWRVRDTIEVSRTNGFEPVFYVRSTMGHQCPQSKPLGRLLSPLRCKNLRYHFCFVF